MGRTLARASILFLSTVIGDRALFAAEPLRLRDVLEAVRADNPAIRAARSRATAAAAMPAQARAYDDPVVSWEAWNIPESVAVARADNNIFRVSQAIPFPGKRRLAGEQATHGAEAMAADAVTVELDTVAAAGRAFWSLWAAHRRLAVFERERAIVERFARVAEQRYALGEVSQPDVLQAQVELTHATNRVETERLAIDIARAELLAFLSRMPDDRLATPEEPVLGPLESSEGSLVELALTRRPDLAAQRATIAREEAGVALADKGYLPDFEVSVGRFINTGAPNGLGAMLSMTVPLAWKGKYDAAASEARARRDAAEAEQRRLEDLVRREVRQAVLAVRTADLQHRLFASTHIPQAEQALRVTEAAYQAGDVDFLRLLETTRTLTTAHLEHTDAAADLERAFVMLERTVGSVVPRGRPAHHPKGP
jgi:outer membrane protein TolC